MSQDDAADDSDDENGEDLDGQASSATISGVPPGAAGDTGVDNGTSPHKFMPPIEVELQMQQLWKKENAALNLMFASGRTSSVSAAVVVEGSESSSMAKVGTGGLDGYRLFFVRALAVPPPRFRPPMNMGDFVAEHPQNVYLTKVRGWVRVVFCWRFSQGPGRRVLCNSFSFHVFVSCFFVGNVRLLDPRESLWKKDCANSQSIQNAVGNVFAWKKLYR